jgi:hypothetical protein
MMSTDAEGTTRVFFSSHWQSVPKERPSAFDQRKRRRTILTGAITSREKGKQEEKPDVGHATRRLFAFIAYPQYDQPLGR